MRTALSAYLAEVEKGLQGVSPSRRRLYLRELEGHLLDEAEARGIEEDGAMEDLLAEKDAPAAVARDFCQGEGEDASHRHGSALLSGGLLGVATGTLLFLQGFPPFLAMGFGIAHGLAVGAGLFWIRPSWQRLDTEGRLAAAALLGALLAIPLGFTRYHLTQEFLLSRLYYGAFTGYLVERHSVRRPLWQLALEVLGFTGFMLLVEYPLTQRLTRFSLAQVQKELVFNITIGLAVRSALALRGLLGRRFLFGRGADPGKSP